MLYWLRNRALMAVALGHFSVDMFSGMVPLILLALTTPLGLSYAQVGFVSTLYTVSSSVTQPFFGWLADRIGGRYLAAFGVMLTATMIGLMRLVDSYTTLTILAPIAGIGSAAFHPQGAANASLASGQRRATGMSIFMLGGNTGFATGPVIATMAFAAAGQSAVAWLTAVGIGLGLLQLVAAPRNQAIQSKHPAAAQSLNSYRPMARHAAIALIIVIFLRQWMQSGLSTYIPQWVRAQGGSAELAGNLLFAMLLPIAIGGLIGGNMADRIGRKPIILTSLILSIPLHLLLLYGNTGPLSFIVAPILGLVVGASFPITLVMAQELLPRGIGIMSGIVLGFSFIAGGIGVAITGWLADLIGLTQTLVGIAFLALIAIGFALVLPRRERRTADGLITQSADAQPAES